MTKGVFSLKASDLMRRVPQGKHASGAFLQPECVDLLGDFGLIWTEDEERRDQDDEGCDDGDKPDPFDTAAHRSLSPRDFVPQRHEREDKSPRSQGSEKSSQRGIEIKPSLKWTERFGYGI
ncbi:MAG: hypothetical protein IKZ41_03075, partial [Clostridia bacterium]|nr:hypothetical protein [Clostridia bacterium]